MQIGRTMSTDIDLLLNYDIQCAKSPRLLCFEQCNAYLEKLLCHVDCTS